MNFIQIAGNLGRDPETRFTPDGKKVTSLNVAVNVRKGGQDVAIWYRVSFWGEDFDKMISYLKKGSSVIVCGILEPPEVYTKNDGTQGVSMNIKGKILNFSPFGRSDSEGQAGAPGAQQQPQAFGAQPAPQAAAAAPGAVDNPFAAAGSASAPSDEEMPF